MVNGHRAKLVHRKQLAVAADPFLGEEGGTAGHLDLDENGDDYQERPEKKQTTKGRNTIKEILYNHKKPTLLQTSGIPNRAIYSA